MKRKIYDALLTWKANDSYVGIMVRVRKTSGNMTIKANGKNYNIYQIVNVDESQRAIKHYVNLAKSK